ncbi:2-oxoglutarate and iron-dependent oxygenase domain-containing protein 2 [Paragonimus heterotremus]|uniref:2-oxoglutarate and iron-dependent oxygenase domain-containing protein 2 n=1 Tax=Paragonimus heterotremus TaxID=100268 RepID=A0A8J4WUM8_9TREM|nr:2-oxoglutarate and iron-dependent oxygenase domain-containing protein 2 [Paragonimus heterotremus]
MEDFTDEFIRLRQMFMLGSTSLPELPTVLEKVSGLDDVYRFPLLTRQCVERLNRLLDQIDERGFLKSRPNTMNHAGLLLSEVPGSQSKVIDSEPMDCGGADIDLMTSLFDCGMRWILGGIFPDFHNRLDSYRVFTVEYSNRTSDTDTDYDLSAHHDNSEVTLNLCLRISPAVAGNGGELFFRHGAGLSVIEDTPGERLDSVLLDHRPGWVVIHRGSHVHGVLPFHSSQDCSRRSLIMWLRSSWHRAKRCPRCFSSPQLIPIKVWYRGEFIDCNKLPSEALSDGGFVRVGFGDGFLMPRTTELCSTI